MNTRRIYCALLIAALFLTGCGKHYVTPGGAVSMFDIAGTELAAHYRTKGTKGAALELTDRDLQAYYKIRPAAQFPANIALVRVQDSGYRSHSYHVPSYGRFSVVTTRDIEADDAFDNALKLHGIDNIVPIGRMLVPANPNTVKDLRTPAARLHADMVLIYTVDTSFTVDGKQLGPLSVVSLGLIPNKKAHVTATVSGMLVDVRTGYIYGTTEATDLQEQRASIWTTGIAIDTARLKAEKNAFAEFVTEFEALWPGVVRAYEGNTAAYRPQEAAASGYHVVDFKDAAQQ